MTPEFSQVKKTKPNTQERLYPDHRSLQKEGGGNLREGWKKMPRSSLGSYWFFTQGYLLHPTQSQSEGHLGTEEGVGLGTCDTGQRLEAAIVKRRAPSPTQSTKLLLAMSVFTEGQEFKEGHACACVLSCFSHVRLFATPWTVAGQVPLSIGFSGKEYWSGLSCPPPGDLPDPEIKPVSPASLADSLPTESPRKPNEGHAFSHELSLRSVRALCFCKTTFYVRVMGQNRVNSKALWARQVT